MLKIPYLLQQNKLISRVSYQLAPAGGKVPSVEIIFYPILLDGDRQ